MDWGLALATTATGIVVVFAVLVILIIIVSVLGKIMDSITNKPKKKAEQKAEILEEKPNIVALETEDGISAEVVAAISGAIAVIMSDEGKAYRIRSVKRTRESRPAWSAAGIQENTRPF